MRTVSATRRQFLVAAGAGLLAPGCLGGGGGPATAPRAQPSAPPRLVGPIRVAVPAGSVDTADVADFTSTRGARVGLTMHPGGPDLAGLVAGGGADAVLARQDDIAALAVEGLLAPLDHSLVPNLADVSPGLLDLPYDPGNRFSAPARHGAFGFAYRPDTVTGEPASWEDFFALLPRYSRRGIVLLPGRIEPIAAALAAGGADINSDDPDDLAAAQRAPRQGAAARERVLDEPGRGVRARGARAGDGGRVGVRAAGADGHVRASRRRRRVVDRRVGGHGRDSAPGRRRTRS